MQTKINSCCSACFGFFTFVSGLIYLLLTLALLVYCYVYVEDELAAVCRGDVSLPTFITITDMVQIALLLTSGCLGMVASKAQTDTIIEGYLVLSSIAFFMSTISMVQSAIFVYSSTGGNWADILDAYGEVAGELSEGQASISFADVIFLTTNVLGFFFTMLSSLVACKAVCCRTKVGVVRQSGSVAIAVY
ncbi:uncharacterized protein [Ptychodera flava]|uniref:uncharacterized protein n=1 Tax=Ptychodera flava TaxID=63121 RepID=UPI00396A1A4A